MKIFIDELNFEKDETGHYIYEMSKVGKTQDDYNLIIRSDDGGKIPHFHYVDAASNGMDKKKGFHTCIRIDKAEYFLHEGKTDILNAKQRKLLVNFLQSKHRLGMTNWKYLVTLWNDNNSDVKFDENQAMPNYLELRD